MDLTIEVMLPPRGAADYSTSANPDWRVLAPVAVYTLRQPATVGMPNTGYVHVTGVPVPQAWAGWTDEQIVARFSERLCALWEDAGATVERRVWAGNAASLPAGVRNTLRTARQVTVTWPQFRGAMRHLVSGATLADSDIG